MEGKVNVKGLHYPVKILIAWGESISGNNKITEWLIGNGYAELGLFHYALRNEERSRDWLMKNGFPHLMALISGAEGSEKALDWLKGNGFDILHEMALVGDRDEDAFDRLIQRDLKLFAMLGKKIESVKNEIEDNKVDFHKYYSS